MMKINSYFTICWVFFTITAPQALMAKNGTGALSDLRMEGGGGGGELFAYILSAVYLGTLFKLFFFDIIRGAISDDHAEKNESRNFLIVAFSMLSCPILGGVLFGFDGVLFGSFLAIPMGYKVNAWHKKEEILDLTYLLITACSFTLLPWAFFILLGDRFLFIFILFLAPISRKINELRYKI